MPTLPSPSLPALVRLLLIVLASPLLAGCRLDLVVDVVVDADGGGELGVTLAADDELIERAEAAGAEPLRTLADAGQDLRSAGWRTAQREAPGGGRSVRLSTRFDDPDEFNRTAAELAGALDAPEVRLIDGLELVLGPDTATVAGRASFAFTEAVTASGLSADEATRRLVEEDAVGYVVRVEMPGEVRSSSAEERVGRLGVWELVPGEARAIEVTSHRPRGSPSSALSGPVLAILALAAVGLVLLLARSIRSRRQP